MLLLGLCAVLSEEHRVSSNMESGEGHFDIQLKPKDTAMPGALIEIKAEKNCSSEELKALAEAARQQIIDRKCDTDLLAEGIASILKYGIAFSGKNVEIVVE